LNTRLTDKIAMGAHARDPNTTRETLARADSVMFLGTPSRSCIASPPRQGGLGDVFRYTIKELHSIATPYATSNKATELHPAQGSREVTLSSGKETPSDVDIHSAKEGAKAAR
jgi:hypothetical protein